MGVGPLREAGVRCGCCPPQRGRSQVWVLPPSERQESGVSVVPPQRDRSQVWVLGPSERQESGVDVGPLREAGVRCGCCPFREAGVRCECWALTFTPDRVPGKPTLILDTWPRSAPAPPPPPPHTHFLSPPPPPPVGPHNPLKPGANRAIFQTT